jgi:serine/threonine-protein kinase
MAPEQVEGHEADARSDIFAFGATLYEMLTGKRAFDGKSQASVIAAILERQPPAVSTTQPTSPRALDRILTGCLAKDPDDRWQSARDVARQLLAIADEQSATVVETPASPPRRTSRAVRSGFAFGAAGLLVGAALTAILFGRFSRPATAPLLPQRVSIVPPTDHPLIFTGAVPQSSLVMSADGRRLAYASNDGWVVRSLDALTVTPLGVFANAAFFSPDGQWLAFISPGKLQKISVSGGRPVTIADQLRNSSPFGDWGEGATIVFPMAGQIAKVSADGGTPVAITTVDAGQGEEHNYPSFVTGAGAVLFTARFDDRPPRIDVLRLDTGERHTVVENARTARYIASGHILFQRDDAVFVVPFDIRTLKVSGQAIPLEQNIRREGQFSAGDHAQLAASATGMLAYVPGEGAANQLGWADASGNYTPLDLPPGRYDLARVSPDGTQIAYEVYVSGGAVWTANNTARVFDIAHGATSQLRNAGPLRAPIWHPDGRALTVFSRRPGAPGIYLVQPDGSERLIVSASDGAELRPGSWSPDGRTLAYTSQGPAGEHVWIVPADEPGSARRLLPNLPHEYGPEFSGDGRWITYTSDVSGRQEVYAMRFPSGAPVRMTFGGAVAGVWHPRANRLFVQAIGQRPAIQEIPLTIREAEIQPGPPRILFEMRVVSSTGQTEAYRTSNNFGPRFDVAPDGRILVARGADPRNLREIVLVQNWFEELKKIAPAK